VIGDGVAAPVVRWLSERLLTPLTLRKSAALAAE
jgi:DNA (cytosine-5)-methyltransferase 1